MKYYKTLFTLRLSEELKTKHETQQHYTRTHNEHFNDKIKEK